MKNQKTSIMTSRYQLGKVMDDYDSTVTIKLKGEAFIRLAREARLLARQAGVTKRVIYKRWLLAGRDKYRQEALATDTGPKTQAP